MGCRCQEGEITYYAIATELCVPKTLSALIFKSKSRLEAENAALRHQLIVLRRKVQVVRINDRGPFIRGPGDRRDAGGSPRVGLLGSGARDA